MTESVLPATRSAPHDASRALRGALLLARLRPFAGPIVTAVLVAGIALRLYSPSPFWLDEAQSVEFASRPLTDLHTLLETDGAPPLYYLLLHGWLDAAGALGLGDGVWVARSFSMAAALAALPLAYLVGRRLGGSRRHGVLTLLVLAANPWAIKYAGEARMYSLVVLLVLVAMLAGDWLRRRQDAAPVIAVAALTAALLLTHYWSIFLLASVAVILLGRAARVPAERPLARRAVIAMAGGGVLFLPWVPTMLHQSAHTGAPWAPRPDLGDLAHLPLEWAGGTGPVGWTLGSMLVPLMLIAVFVRRRTGSDVVIGVRPGGVTGLLGLLLAGTLVLALAVSMASGGAVVGRYSAVVVPVVVLLIAFGIVTLPRTAGLAVLSLLVGLGLLGGVTVATTDHSHAGRVADALGARAGAGDLLVYCPDQLAPGVEARLDVPGLERVSLPAQRDPRVVDWTDYTDAVDALRLRRLAEDITDVIKADPGAAVWLITAVNPYRTHTEVCDPLRTRLVAALGVPNQVLDGTARGGEKAVLERFTR
ncbi:MAG: glycosyltransferase family 39 protein [Sporichthyaceae bacterium]